MWHWKDRKKSYKNSAHYNLYNDLCSQQAACLFGEAVGTVAPPCANNTDSVINMFFSLIKGPKIQVSGVGGLASLAKKGIGSSTFAFDSLKPHKSEI